MGLDRFRELEPEGLYWTPDSAPTFGGRWDLLGGHLLWHRVKQYLWRQANFNQSQPIRSMRTGNTCSLSQSDRWRTLVRMNEHEYVWMNTCSQFSSIWLAVIDWSWIDAISTVLLYDTTGGDPKGPNDRQRLAHYPALSTNLPARVLKIDLTYNNRQQVENYIDQGYPPVVQY